MDSLLEKLSQPFPPKYIDWKPGATKGDRCMALAYADLRVYQDRLDEICGLNWSVRYVPWSDGRIICELTINGITRASTGEMSALEEKGGNGGTVAEAQAMKRAAAMFGLGRFLYELPSVWVDFDANAKTISKAGMAELDRRYRDWYAKAIAAAQKAKGEQPQQEGQVQHRNVVTGKPAEQPTENPFEDDTPYYVRDFNRLTGKHYDFVKWATELHRSSDGPCTKDQYHYLVGIVDALSNKQHNYILSLLCQTEINSGNVPGERVASELIKILPEQTRAVGEDGKPAKDEKGKAIMIANPKYRATVAQLVKDMAQPIPEPTSN